MKKYIKSQREGSLIYEIERQEYSEKFRTPENYFAHATRRVWYSTTGFTVFVQYKGTFYMIDRVNGDQITTLVFDTVTAEEAAAAKMERAAQAMSEAQEHEAKTAAAALDYDTETAEAEAREARFSAAYAEILAKDAAELAAKAGTSNAASIADIASEYAEQAREYARRATETAEQNARELEERAEIIAAIEDDQQRDYIEAEATAHQWTPDETRAAIEYRTEIAAANRAALALLNAYAEAIGEYPGEDDDETHAAYLVARDDLTGTSQRASEYDRETVELMTEAIARAARPADLSKYENMKYLEFDQPEPAPIYQRYELEAYLGDPDAYDVDAIEAEATTYTADGARVWTAFGDDLAAIAERHELYSYAPAI